MKIDRKKIDAKPEIDLLTGLIVSDNFVQEIFPILNISYLQISYVRVVAQWCIEYFQKYSRAPYEDIQKIFENNKRVQKLDEDTIEIIEDFLISLNKKFSALENFNERFLLDETKKYLQKRKLEILRDDLSGYLFHDDLENAEQILSAHSKVESLSYEEIDFFHDEKKVVQKLMEEEEYIFRYPGVLGKMIGPVSRTDFFSFIGPMKRGKSFWLVDFAIRASLQNLKVLYISLEMPMKQVIGRLSQNILGGTKRDGLVSVPYFDEQEVKHKNVNKKGIKISQIVKKNRKLDMMVKAGGLKIICYPSRSANLHMIRKKIYEYGSKQQYFPDVVIIDYLDILKPEPNAPRDKRDVIDDTWSTARGLALEINGIVVTVSQSNRATFSKNVDEEGVAEDIRKLAHVTHMVALNQTRDEKKANIMRLGMVVGRSEEFHIEEEVAVAYQYGIGKAYLDSRWNKEIIF